MSTASFSAGAVIELYGRAYKLLRLFEGGTWQIEDVVSKRIVEKPIADLQQAYVDGHLVFTSDDPSPSIRKDALELKLQMLDPKRYEVAKWRRTYVRDILDLPLTPRLINQQAQKTWERQGRKGRKPSFAALARYKRRYLASNCDIFSLCPRLVGNRSWRFPVALDPIVAEVVKTVFLTRERRTIHDTWEAAVNAVASENRQRTQEDQLPLPTRGHVEARIRQIPAFDRYAARYGAYAAKVKFRAVFGHSNPTGPLDRVQIDHTRVDLMPVDDVTGLPCGRPWLTVCLDVFTRCILGIYIGFEPPSYLTVARCLKHAVMPKVGVKEKYGLTFDWVAHGVMKTLVVDNGLEFHSEALEQACHSLGIDIEFCARQSPWMKGEVERVIGTINRGIAHVAPGTTFANIFDKDDYDPAKHAVVKMSTLRHAIHKWIVDYYHQRTHSSLDASPADMWKSSISQDDILIPENPARLDAILGRPVKRVLDREGIRMDGELRYNSAELTALRQRVGSRIDVDVRCDDTDVGHVVVFTPEGQMLRVPEINQAYSAGLSRWQHKVCQRIAKNKFPNKVGIESLAAAKAFIASIYEADHVDLGKKRRSAVARQRWNEAKARTAQATPAIPPTKVVSATEVRPIAPAALNPARQIAARKFTPIITTNPVDPVDA